MWCDRSRGGLPDLCLLAEWGLVSGDVPPRDHEFCGSWVPVPVRDGGRWNASVERSAGLWTVPESCYDRRRKSVWNTRGCFSWKRNILECSFHTCGIWLHVAPEGRIRTTMLAGHREEISSKVELLWFPWWIRICLPMQGTWVWSLVLEDATCHGATKPVASQLRSLHSRARQLQLLKPVHLEPVLPH